MIDISPDEGVEIIFDSLVAQRLTVLAGAGLSMAPPSNLPSAAAVAASVKKRYTAMYGTTRPPLPDDIGQQADFFFQRGQLPTLFLRSLIEPNTFAGPPNAGHSAIADLLLVGGIQTAVTTNVDLMIETAGQHLLGHIGAGIDEAAIVSLLPNTSPLLKVHGCCHIDIDTTVWTDAQLQIAPIAERIAFAKHWLATRLLNRDLLVIGYWTDWDYLNAVLEATLDTVNPSAVVVVDPGDSATFQAKAPALYALGLKTKGGFKRVPASGADFLANLRKRFSGSFLRAILHAGVDAYTQGVGLPPDAALTEPPELDNDELWNMRRDLEGCAPGAPARLLQPPAEPLLGMFLLQLRHKGAAPDGSLWSLGGKRIRVLRSPNTLLHMMEAAHARDIPPPIAPDMVVAVGAETQNLPANIVRSGAKPTITRGSLSRWVTRSQAIEELAL
jgi:SIR2-like domain